MITTGEKQEKEILPGDKIGAEGKPPISIDKEAVEKPITSEKNKGEKDKKIDEEQEKNRSQDEKFAEEEEITFTTGGFDMEKDIKPIIEKRYENILTEDKTENTADKKEERKEWTKENKEAEINGFLDKLSLYNENLPKELCDEMIIINLEPNEKIKEMAEKFDHIAYKTRDGKIILLDRVWGNKIMDENGKEIEGEYDRKHVLFHEVGHRLADIEGLIYTSDEILGFYNILNNIESIKNEDIEKLSPHFREIVKTIKNPDAFKNKESAHIQLLFNKLKDEKALKVEFDNIKQDSKSFEEYKKSYPILIAREIIAERLSYYLMAKDKSPENGPLEMLRERILRSPAKSMQEYLKIDEEAYKKITAETDEGKTALKEMLENAKDENSPFQQLFNENKVFFEGFKETLGAKSADKIRELFESGNEIAIDEFDELFTSGGFYGEGGAMGASEGGGKGFLEWLFEIFSMIFGGKSQ